MTITKHFLTLLLGLVTTGLLATPSSSIWHTETILGVSNDSYYILQNIRNTGNTYYNHTDSTFIIGRSLATGEEIEKTLIRVVEHKDTTANGDWIAIEIINIDFDILNLLKEKFLFPVYSKDIELGKDFLINDKGYITSYNENLNKQYLIEYSCDKKTLASRIRLYMEHLNTDEQEIPEKVIQVQQSNSNFFIGLPF